MSAVGCALPRDPTAAPARSRRLAPLFALLALAATAFALRSIGLEQVFAPDGSVIFENGDGPYHARLAHYVFMNFPSFLSWDPYLAGPLGGAVPWPPGFDLLIAGVARLLGAAGIDRVLAWSGPVVGTLTVLMVYVAARALVRPWPAVGAAALQAGFGSPISYSTVGNGDHHGWMALLGATWLSLALRFVRPDTSLRRLSLLSAGMAAIRTAVLLTWSGSLLYVAIADGSVGLVCIAYGDTRALRALAVGLLATALAATPVVRSIGATAGGPFSSIMLSWFHLVVLAALATFVLALSAWEGYWPARSLLRRLLRPVLAALAIAAGLLAIGPIRADVLPALRFLTLNDAAGAGTVEQLPLFSLFGRRPLYPATVYFGGFAYAIPLVPLFALLAARRPQARRSALVLAAWTAPFVLLTLTQLRYGNDLAGPAALGFVLALGSLASALSSPRSLGPRGSGVLVAALGLALLVPSLRDFVAHAGPSLRYVLDRGTATQALDAKGSLARFARTIREVTPETPGFDGPGVPDYGLLANPSIGHSLRYYSRRPVAADNFWDKFPTFALARDLLWLVDEREAYTDAGRLRVRYVVTMPEAESPASLNERLHVADGNASGGYPRLEHFRLVTEGPPGGVPLLAPFGLRVPPGTLAYKLFEIVPGAVLEVSAPPRSMVEATLDLETPTPRRFTVVARAIADAKGVARIRVPYATQAALPTRALGPWRLTTADGGIWRIDVGEEDVTAGRVVPVAALAR